MSEQEILNQELDKVIKKDPLLYTIFENEFRKGITCYKHDNFNYDNTVYEYNWRHSCLACFGGFIVEYKYKDRHLLDDQKYVNMWIKWFNEWWEKGLVMPAVMGGGVIKTNLSLLDNERKQFISINDDGTYTVTNLSVPSMLLERSAVVEYNANCGHENDNAPLGKIDWEQQQNVKHQYTEEELGELTVRTVYSLFVFPSHELNMRQYYHNLFDKERNDESNWKPIHKIMNEVTGTRLFNPEGALPEVVFQLEVDQSK